MLDSKYEKSSYVLQLWLEDVVVTQCVHYDVHPQDLYLEIGNVVQKREDKEMSIFHMLQFGRKLLNFQYFSLPGVLNTI